MPWGLATVIHNIRPDEFRNPPFLISLASLLRSNVVKQLVIFTKINVLTTKIVLESSHVGRIRQDGETLEVWDFLTYSLAV